MTTRITIQAYFDSLKAKGQWDAFFADDMQFTSYTTPIKHVTGRDAYVESTKRFYSLIQAVEIKNMLVEGERACVLTRYTLQPPGGRALECHVAEVFVVRADKIQSLDIYFDSAPFPK